MLIVEDSMILKLFTFLNYLYPGAGSDAVGARFDHQYSIGVSANAASRFDSHLVTDNASYQAHIFDCCLVQC